MGDCAWGWRLAVVGGQPVCSRKVAAPTRRCNCNGFDSVGSAVVGSRSGRGIDMAGPIKLARDRASQLQLLAVGPVRLCAHFPFFIDGSYGYDFFLKK